MLGTQDASPLLCAGVSGPLYFATFCAVSITLGALLHNLFTHLKAYTDLQKHLNTKPKVGRRRSWPGWPPWSNAQALLASSQQQNRKLCSWSRQITHTAIALQEPTLLHGVDVSDSFWFKDPKVLAAVEFAAKAHAGQVRKSSSQADVVVTALMSA